MHNGAPSLLPMEILMSLLRTYFAGKAKQLAAEQHWQSEMQAVVRPQQIKLRAAEQILAVQSTLKADAELSKIFGTLKLTNPTG